MRRESLKTGLAIFLAGWMAGGCALYSETREKQGQAAKEAWGKVDLQEQIAVPRKNLQALLDEQLAIEDEIWTTRRAQLARSMAYSWTVGELSVRVNQEMQRVVGSEQDAVALQTTLDNIELARGTLTGQSAVAASLGLTRPSCDSLLDPARSRAVDEQVGKIAKPDMRAAMLTVVALSKPPCQVLKQGLQGVNMSGEMLSARAALSSDVAALSEDQAKTAAARARYQAALAEYEQAAADLVVNPTANRDKVGAALKKLADLAGLLQDQQDVFSVKFVSEERLASLNRFLSTYSDLVAGKPAPADPSRAAIALAVFPDLVDKARVSLKDVEKPNLVPLVLQKNLEQARLEAAERDIATRRRLIAFRQAHVDGLTAQVDAYKAAGDALGAKGVKDVFANAPLRDALTPVSGKEANDPKGPFESKQKMWKAVALYLDAEGRLRAEVGKTRYRITALQREKALTYAESNINQWKALIDPSVELMAAYGASGLKSSDIMAFLNTLTLVWIAVGVN